MVTGGVNKVLGALGPWDSQKWVFGGFLVLIKAPPSNPPGGRGGTFINTRWRLLRLGKVRPPYTNVGF